MSTMRLLSTTLSTSTDREKIKYWNQQISLYFADTEVPFFLPDQLEKNNLLLLKSKLLMVSIRLLAQPTKTTEILQRAAKNIYHLAVQNKHLLVLKNDLEFKAYFHSLLESPLTQISEQSEMIFKNLLYHMGKFNNGNYAKIVDTFFYKLGVKNNPNVKAMVTTLTKQAKLQKSIKSNLKINLSAGEKKLIAKYQHLHNKVLAHGRMLYLIVFMTPILTLLALWHNVNINYLWPAGPMAALLILKKYNALTTKLAQIHSVITYEAIQSFVSLKLTKPPRVEYKAELALVLTMSNTVPETFSAPAPTLTGYHYKKMLQQAAGEPLGKSISNVAITQEEPLSLKVCYADDYVKLQDNKGYVHLSKASITCLFTTQDATSDMTAGRFVTKIREKQKLDPLTHVERESSSSPYQGFQKKFRLAGNPHRLAFIARPTTSEEASLGINTPEVFTPKKLVVHGVKGYK